MHLSSFKNLLTLKSFSIMKNMKIYIILFYRLFRYLFINLKFKMGCTQGKSKPPQPGTQPSKPLESNSSAVVPPNAVNSTISNK